MYSHIVLGGTFDHLHAGHRELLSFAFSQGQKVTLGLTKASMNTSKALSSEIQTYVSREKAITEFARSLQRDQDLCIIPIHDVFGSTLTDQTLDAIIVTPQTEKGAHFINSKRVQLGLPSLPIQACPLVKDDDGNILCSSNIRSGITDREGKSYQKIFSKDIVLSQSARETLRRPFGQAIGASKLQKLKGALIIVGDVATQHCIDHKISFSRSYIDGYSQRKPYALTVSKEYSLKKFDILNPAGSITRQAIDLITQEIGSDKEIRQINGEEDLLTVALVVLLPFGTHIVYGYPYEPKGMRMITINERVKVKFAQLLID
ncbi:MAG: pantetheine-phosphate adenylyltransferase [Candidatus Woesebacteria bacterium]